MAYRMRYVTGIATYAIFVGVQYFVWRAVFAARTEPAVEVDTDYDRDDPKVGPGTTSDPNQADRT